MRADTIVLGAGIVGISVALHLQKAGRSVVLVDKAGLMNEHGEVLNVKDINDIAPSISSGVVTGSFDESEGADRALAMAASLAAVNPEAHVDVVYVVPIPLLDETQPGAAQQPAPF